MAIEKFDELIGTWAPVGSKSHGERERELFHFSPLGHFVMEWGSEERARVQICDLALTRDGFSFKNRMNGSATELEASVEGPQLVLIPPNGARTVLERVVAEMEAEDAAFFVRGEE